MIIEVTQAKNGESARQFLIDAIQTFAPGQIRINQLFWTSPYDLNELEHCFSNFGSAEFHWLPNHPNVNSERAKNFHDMVHNDYEWEVTNYEP